MRHTRALLALGAVAAVLGVFGSITLWKAGRALRASSQQMDREASASFTAAVLDLAAPAGFESISAPAGFRDAAVFGGRLYVAGDGGVFEYEASGALVKQYRAGLELPAAPVTAIAVGASPDVPARELWAATSGEGALAYDGTRFRHIRPDRAGYRKMTCVLPLATGRVLFGTDRAGVIAFDGKQLGPLHPSLADLRVTALAGDEASLWIGTQDRGLLHWHAGQLDRYDESNGMPDRRVAAIAIAGGVTYAATALGIAELREGKVQRTLAQGFTVQSVLPFGNRLLAGTLDEGLIRVPLEARSRPAGAASDACPGCAVHRLLVEGGEALALTGNGLYRTGAQSADWIPILGADEARLTDRNIAAIAPGPDGRVWIGYFDRGLDILDTRASRAEHIEDDVIFCVNRIVHDRARDRTAVATANGLAMFTPAGSQRQVLTRADGLIANHVTDVLFRGDGALIAGTPAGVSFIEPGGISSIYAFHGLVNNHVYALGQMGNRTMVGTLGGLSVIESGLAAASFTTANSGFKHNWITAVLPTSEDVLVGTYGGGIMHLGPGGAWLPFADLPPSFEVNPNAMAASPGAVYAGTLDRGLAVFARSSSRWRWVTRGLPSLNVTAVAVEAGQVYIGTDNGLVRASEEALVR